MKEIESILRSAKTIAVVGLSDNPARDSNHVAEYMQRHGYRIIPVNPALKEVLGEKSYPSLLDIPEPVDIVDVFRRADAVPEIAEQAIKIGAKCLWLQEGVVHEEAVRAAQAAGLAVAMDLCILKVHAALLG